MSRYRSQKHTRHIGALHDDLLHVIFSKLDSHEKLKAGLVSKQWDQLLKAGTPAARHWNINYRVKKIVKSPDAAPDYERVTSDHPTANSGRWFGSHAAAINHLRVEAHFAPDGGFCGTLNNPTLECLEAQLPLLAGALSKHDTMMSLAFYDKSPFRGALLSDPAFLTLLSPMVQNLRLVQIEAIIGPAEFAAMCQLTNLEELYIHGYSSESDEPEGLQELTSDISKLVKLESLEVTQNLLLDYMPDSISCLQNLEILILEDTSITQVPAGLATLQNLDSLTIRGCEAMQLPLSLQGLRSLSELTLSECHLLTIPEALSGLSALTYLDLSGNHFDSHDPHWWPTSLSRLTKLVKLVMHDAMIYHLPAHISGVAQLTMLDISGNFLHSLPDELSGLQNLKELDVSDGILPGPPVSVLSKMTALSSINLRDQSGWTEGEDATFKISSTLLPIFNSGLVVLDVRQRRYAGSIGKSGPKAWDGLSLFHLGRALADLGDRKPVPTLLF